MLTAVDQMTFHATGNVTGSGNCVGPSWPNNDGASAVSRERNGMGDWR